MTGTGSITDAALIAYLHNVDSVTNYFFYKYVFFVQFNATYEKGKAKGYSQFVNWEYAIDQRKVGVVLLFTFEFIICRVSSMITNSVYMRIFRYRILRDSGAYWYHYRPLINIFDRIKILFFVSTFFSRIVPRPNFTDPNEPSHDVTLLIEGEKIYVNKGVIFIRIICFEYHEGSSEMEYIYFTRLLHS